MSRAALADTSRGWSAWWLAVITAAIAAAAPATAAVYGYITKDKEIALASIAKSKEIVIAERAQEFTMRTQLLDRAIDVARPLQDRQQVLRFLVAVITDERMRSWAEDELRRVEKELTAVKDLAKANEATKFAEEALTKALARVRALQSQGKSLSSASAKWREEAENAREEARVAQLARDEAEKVAAAAQRRFNDTAPKMSTTLEEKVPTIPDRPFGTPAASCHASLEVWANWKRSAGQSGYDLKREATAMCAAQIYTQISRTSVETIQLYWLARVEDKSTNCACSLL